MIDETNQKDEKIKDNQIEKHNQDLLTKEQNDMDLQYKNKKEVAKGGVLGAFIGLAIIVPGVSGSVVAIIFKLYEKLLFAIGNLFKQFKKCFKFLLPIALGVIVGFVVGFFTVQKLLDILPFIIISLFAGLMLGAYPAVTDEIKGTQKTAKNISLFAVGLMVPAVVSIISIFANGNQSLASLNIGHYVLFVVLGFLVTITQLVPGLSATALLMAFGYFTSLMNSVSLSYFKSNPSIFLVYLCLIVGAVLGLLVVPKQVSKLLNKHRISSFYTICGLSLGSILTMFFNNDTINVYSSWNATDIAINIIVGLVVFAIGVAVSYWFVKFERNKNNTKQ